MSIEDGDPISIYEPLNEDLSKKNKSEKEILGTKAYVNSDLSESSTHESNSSASKFIDDYISKHAGHEPRARLDLGDILIDNGYVDAAKEQYRIVIYGKDDGLNDALVNVGRILIKENKQDEFIDITEVAINNDPSNHSIYLNLIELALANNLLDLAKHFARIGIERNPGNQIFIDIWSSYQNQF